MQEKAKEADLAQKFKSQLNSSKDGFDVVAEYFGKGIFNKVRKTLGLLFCMILAACHLNIPVVS